MNLRRSRDLPVFGTALIVLAADQISKYWVRQHLALGVPWDPAQWLRPVLRFTYVTNTGAAFGILRQLAPVYPFVAVAVIVAILFFYRRLPTDQTLILLSLGLQLGGAAGNLMDRLASVAKCLPSSFPGLMGLWEALKCAQVTDFIDLNFWPLQEWPVFNLADSSVVVGVCILALYLFLEEEPSAAFPDHLADGDEHA